MRSNCVCLFKQTVFCFSLFFPFFAKSNQLDWPLNWAALERSARARARRRTAANCALAANVPHRMQECRFLRHLAKHCFGAQSTSSHLHREAVTNWPRPTAIEATPLELGAQSAQIDAPTKSRVTRNALFPPPPPPPFFLLISLELTKLAGGRFQLSARR